MLKRLFNIILALCLSLSCFASGVSAPAEWSDSAVWLGDVTVTAIKQTSDLALQPLAATVVGQKQLEQFSITSMKGVSEIAPNFYIPDYGSRITSSIYVRGIGSRMDNSAVGLTVDNVPFLNKNAYDFAATDIERIEVLRGPQSSLYGRNTMGGQVNIYTLKPMDWQGSRVAATVGNGPAAFMSVAHYQKFTPDLAMSFSGNFMFSDGYYKNYYNAKKVGAEKGGSLRWTTQWQISPTVAADNTASFNYTQQSGYPYEYLGSDRVNYNDTCFYRRNVVSDALTVKWNAGKFTLSSITSFQHLTDNLTLDQDFLPLNYFTLTQAVHETSVTQDVVIRGDVGNYSWLGGVFGFYKHNSMRAPVIFADDGIAALITDRVNNNDKIPVRLAFDTPTIPLLSDFKNPTYGVALYHQSNFKVNKFNFALGLRLDYESTRLDYTSVCHTGISAYMKSGVPPVPIVKAPIDIDEGGRLKDHFLEFMPKFTLSYDLPMKSGSSIYASVGEGYKSGGFNTQMFSQFLQNKMMNEVNKLMPMGGAPEADLDVDRMISYKPERSWNYEIGAHIGCAQGRVMTDIALFYIDLTDQQVTTLPEGDLTGRITTNAGKSRSFGAELQIRYNPTSNWDFRVAYGYTNAKFRQFIDGTNNYKGKTVPYAPQNTLFLSAAYNHNIGADWHLTYNVNMRGIGKIYWNEANDAAQNFYALPGASVTANRQWIELEGWIENITGTKYSTFYFESVGNRFVQKGRPRLFGLTVRLFFNTKK
ncbi:MAG: TonB-dependent receptor [Firmicutes bacterium]|nr:TonB-dependent receptor [Bacillota bacterium]MCM1400652.1 TonB-dependent receptor [Bacteroides sp.]MCM1476343.1 TonB-dependent receptor [Bacteroides sp.]